MSQRNGHFFLIKLWKSLVDKGILIIQVYEHRLNTIHRNNKLTRKKLGK